MTDYTEYIAKVFRNSKLIGTGWLINDQTFITAGHCFDKGEKNICIKSRQGEDFPSSVRMDPDLDAAILQVDNMKLKLKPLAVCHRPESQDNQAYSWKSYGFPVSVKDVLPEGMTIGGEIRNFNAIFGSEKSPAIQLHCKERVDKFYCSDAKILGGMSGSPVIICEHSLYVVGMIRNAPPEFEESVIFASPIDEIVKKFNNELSDVELKPFQIWEFSSEYLDMGTHCQSDSELESPYGTMNPESRFYIERKADKECWSNLSLKQAVTIFIKGPWQTGKSSLMKRMIYRAKEELDIESAFIDFQEFERRDFEDLKKFLIQFCIMIGDSLHIPEKICDYWESLLSDKAKCGQYISKHIITRVNKPFIIAMDEVQRIFGTPISNEFFGMLRVWHNNRAKYPGMSLFLSSSTEPHLFIDDLNQSPFNVGPEIIFQDFTPPEVEKLNRLHQAPLNQSQLKALLDLVGGHPFLIRLSLYLLANGTITFDGLMSKADSDSGPFENHLNRYWSYISESPEIKKALLQILHSHAYPANKLYYKLKGAGLIRKSGSKVLMRNKLYEKYFLKRLNNE